MIFPFGSFYRFLEELISLNFLSLNDRLMRIGRNVIELSIDQELVLLVLNEFPTFLLSSIISETFDL